MDSERYCMSFTTGGLLYNESVKIAELYLELKDWNIVRTEVISKNLLQARRQNTSRRVCSEIISRLKKLTISELELLINSSFKEQNYILWIAVCRRYKFIGDFGREVLRERYLSMQTEIHYEDYEYYFSKKSELHPELDDLSPATRYKLRQIVFKMLKEAEILSVNNIINPTMLSPRLQEAIQTKSHENMQFFPVLESDLGVRV